VAEKLAHDIGWEPCYWVSADDIASLVKQRFPNIVFHSNLDAVRGIAPAEYADLRPEALSGPELIELTDCQVTALHMMDRLDALGSFRFDERVRLYHRLLSHWLSVLNETCPDFVVFSQAPHLVYDYVLYSLCKQKGIKTVIFEFTRVGGLLFPTASIEGTTPLMQRYERLLANYTPGCTKISDSSHEHLKAMSGAYDDIPPHVHPFYGLNDEFGPGRERTNVQNQPSPILLMRRLARLLREPIAVAWRSSRRLAPPNYMKQPGKKMEESRMSGLKYFLYRVRSRRRMNMLEASYRRMARQPDMTKPFVYVPLAYQPERTTSPLGGVFVNQILMVQLLSACLPEGWYLYVKEHPTQFLKNQAFRAQSGRTKDLYDDLASIPNVILVDTSVPSFELTDNSLAVASVVSTAGWEAVVRRTPTLAFGYPWYRGCEGVFHTQTKQDCIEVFKKISEGYEVDQEKVRLFIQALEQIGDNGYVDKYYYEIAAISPEENTEAIARSIKKFTETKGETSDIIN
jgi:hypothetical protein